MKIVFRVDASTRIGIGHLMRCLTLAETLRERGAQPHFICREHAGHLIPLLQKKAIPVTVLPAPAHAGTAPSEDHTAWLGVSQAEDADQTLQALKGDKPEWLVVDHYALDRDWEWRLRPYVGKLLVIDDLANRPHECELLLDQNYFTGGERRYAERVPAHCKRLEGPRYALMTPEYAAYRQTLRPRGPEVRRVLVFFGGTDLANMTGLALEALSHPDLRHLIVDVVAGANYPHCDALEAQAARRPNTTIHRLRASLGDLMAQADLAVGAGGTTTWERMCLGLPTLVVTIADNQRPGTEALASAQLIQNVGHYSSVSAESLSAAIVEWVANPSRLAKISLDNQLVVDGLGALRTREVLIPTDTAQIRLRKAGEGDMVSYFNWANDPEVRRSATRSETIAWGTHKEWFTKKLRDADSHLYVLEAAGLPVGQIRFDKEGSAVRIDYSLDKLVRGRGWGSRLVSLGAEAMHKVGVTSLRAEVKKENAASRSIFLRLGFMMAEGKNNHLIFLRDVVPAPSAIHCDSSLTES